MIFVSPHAVHRFQERVSALSYDDARDAILAGSRLVLDGLKVVTAYGRGMLPRQCRTCGGAG